MERAAPRVPEDRAAGAPVDLRPGERERRSERLREEQDREIELRVEGHGDRAGARAVGAAHLRLADARHHVGVRDDVAVGDDETAALLDLVAGATQDLDRAAGRELGRPRRLARGGAVHGRRRGRRDPLEDLGEAEAVEEAADLAHGRGRVRQGRVQAAHDRGPPNLGGDLRERAVRQVQGDEPDDEEGREERDPGAPGRVERSEPRAASPVPHPRSEEPPGGLAERGAGQERAEGHERLRRRVAEGCGEAGRQQGAHREAEEQPPVGGELQQGAAAVPGHDGDGEEDGEQHVEPVHVRSIAREGLGRRGAPR
ncbi:hypothetical protein HRbin12_00208 [bacterium HR12]|nr:hypothetical protein HRbin12_00208 [bacterium HR12]